MAGFSCSHLASRLAFCSARKRQDVGRLVGFTLYYLIKSAGSGAGGFGSGSRLPVMMGAHSVGLGSTGQGRKSGYSTVPAATMAIVQ